VLQNDTTVRVEYPEPHRGRRQKILEAHPEVTKLFGYRRRTFLIVLGVVAVQMGIAVLLIHQPWWVVLIAAYTIGAIMNHMLYVLVHDATHNLIFKTTNANKWAAIVACLPQFFPGTIAFRRFHLLHHRFQGEMDNDADLAGPVEARIVGRSSIMKSLWMLFFFLVEGVVRPFRLKHIKWIDRWSIINLFAQIAFVGGMFLLSGFAGITYLALATIFGIGLHPLGARWIQEHYLFKEGQETYSYYGPANIINLNVGYHNEHHDFMNIPWMNLPKLKKLAPEFYDNLHCHTSYTRLLFRFLFDPEVNLYSRAVRPSLSSRNASKVAA